VAYVLALASAALYGAADFLGGLAARRTSAIVTVLISQAAGAVLLVAVLPFLPAASPTTRDLAWGATAGLAGGIGVALLYRALAVGVMGVVAPTTAVCAVAIPVIAGIAAGERPGAITAAGMGLALVAIVLVSQASSASAEATADKAHDPSVGAGLSAFARATADKQAGHPAVGADLSALATATADRQVGPVPAGFVLALLSGVAIGLFFLALARTASTAGLWPLLVARGLSVALFRGIALASRVPVRVTRSLALLIVSCGAIDMTANALYLIATRYGTLSVIVTLASLYPASTVVLARFVLHERFSRWQTAGIVCALVAVAMIVGGSN
jgi:drug/metabolite transporter (DMT)-like permease